MPWASSAPCSRSLRAGPPGPAGARARPGPGASPPARAGPSRPAGRRRGACPGCRSRRRAPRRRVCSDSRRTTSQPKPSSPRKMLPIPATSVRSPGRHGPRPPRRARRRATSSTGQHLLVGRHGGLLVGAAAAASRRSPCGSIRVAVRAGCPGGPVDRAAGGLGEPSSREPGAPRSSCGSSLRCSDGVSLMASPCWPLTCGGSWHSAGCRGRTARRPRRGGGDDAQPGPSW